MLAQQFCQWPVPTAAPGTVLCVGLLLEDMTAWASQCVPYTTAHEQHAASRFAHMKDTVRHLAGRALARRMLWAVTGQNSLAAFARSPLGKPFCPQTTANFSISHAGNMVWAALCRTAAVGIDVEEIHPLPDAVDLTSQLHPQERQALLALPAEEMENSFFRCWTRKEATLKACGTGLNTPLHSFCVCTEQQQANWILSAPAGHVYASQCAAPISDQWTSQDIATAAPYQCSMVACGPHLEVVAHVA